MKVKKLNMARWIVALRSGKYGQTRGELRNAAGYCCLGVACNISKLGRWNKSKNDEAGDDSKLYVIGEGKRQTRDDALLPEKVRSWLGLDSENPVLFQCPSSFPGEPSLSIAASRANDSYHLSFAEIADKLEARYLDGKKAEDIVARAKARARKKAAA